MVWRGAEWLGAPTRGADSLGLYSYPK